MQEQLPTELSVPFPLRFLFASNPSVMCKALGIVYRSIATQLVHKAGYTKTTAQTGAVTLIQRFGSVLNLNIPKGTLQTLADCGDDPLTTRVGNDVDTCDKCGGNVRIIASIEDPVVIRTILANLDEQRVIATDCR